jgi:hypothetical protein
MWKILLKFPTRSRPEKAREALKKYAALATHPEQMGIAITCDLDDKTMDIDLSSYLTPFGWSKVFYGNSKSKIQACNADIDKVDFAWDIIVLISDDMIPQVSGYDEIIRNACTPDLDCILWFNDGHQENNLNTLTIFGRKMYDYFGYLYHPSYYSFYCDTELTDLCKNELKDKCIYSSECIIKHEHPGLYGKTQDSLYYHNQRYWSTDMRNYIDRKAYKYDWSILIPTLEERVEKYNALKTILEEKMNRICPDLRIEILSVCDNRELSVGKKRQKLIEMSSGKYISFIDDDDLVTDEYFEDAAVCIREKYDVCRLRGTIGIATFTHSLRNTLDGPAAAGYEFLRPPNHLNVMLKDIAALFKFEDLRRGEDMEWMVRLSNSGFLKKEYASAWSRVHYIYNYRAEITKKDIDDQCKMTCTQLVYVILGKPIVVSNEKRLRFGPKGFVSV